MNKKAELTKQSKILLGILGALAIIATVWILIGDNAITEQIACGETICSEFNQEFRGWSQDTLQCTFNYEQFGYEGVDEVFTFLVNDSYKQEMCGGMS